MFYSRPSGSHFWYGTLIGWFVLLSGPAAVAAPVVVNLKTTFGAVGNGVADDQPAFDKAEAFLKTHPDQVKLLIPAGTYVVGRQHGLLGDNPLQISKCTNLTIEGAGPARTHIRFRDGMKFGAFDPATGQPLSYGVPGGSDKVATPGYFIWLEECTNVRIKGLDVDGNNPHFRVGGPVSDGGYQVSNDGIILMDCNAVTLEQVTLRYFGRDGLQIKHGRHPTTFASPSNNFQLRDCAFEYNGRQGLSWTGGKGLTATRCKFNHTGRGRIQSAPGAGVDIEAEDGSKIEQGLFRECEFIDNVGVGMVSDQPELARDIRAIHFERCLFWGTSAYSTWVRKIGFSFSYCTFFGTIVHGCDAATDADATKYDHCSFELRPYQGKPAFGTLLVETYLKGFRMQFTNCHFRLNTYGQSFYYVFLGDHPAADFVRFRGCDFVVRYQTDPTQNALSYLVGGLFEGNNRFLDSTAIRRPGPPPARNASQKLITTSFSPAVVSGGTLTLAGGPDIMHKSENQRFLTVGRDAQDAAALILANHNELLVYSSTLTVNDNARLVVQRGGLLRATAGATFVINGTLVLEDGAYLCLDPSTTLRWGPKAQLLRAPGAIIGTDEQRYPSAVGKPACMGDIKVTR